MDKNLTHYDRSVERGICRSKYRENARKTAINPRINNAKRSRSLSVLSILFHRRETPVRRKRAADFGFLSSRHSSPNSLQRKTLRSESHQPATRNVAHLPSVRGGLRGILSRALSDPVRSRRYLPRSRRRY